MVELGGQQAAQLARRKRSLLSAPGNRQSMTQPDVVEKQLCVVSFAPTSPRLAPPTHQCTLHTLPQVWDTNTLACLATLTGHTGPVRTLVRCGDKVFSGSYDKTVRVWDVNTHKCLATLVGHTGAVRALAASDTVVFSGSDDTTIRVGGADRPPLLLRCCACSRWWQWS